MKNCKFITIIIVLIITITSSLLVANFVMDLIDGPDFIPDDELYAFDKDAIDTFYTEFPEMISQGKVMDVKYTFYNQRNPYGSVFVFLSNEAKPKAMNSLEVKFNTIKDGKMQENTYINEYHNSYHFYDDVNYSKREDKLRVIRKSFKMLLGSYAPERYEDFVLKYGELDLNEFTFTFNFTDGSNEVHHVVGDKDKSLKMASYKLDKTMEEIINEYEGPVDFIEYYNDSEGDINKLIINLDVKYSIFPEEGLNEIYQYFELIGKSKNRKKILENENVLNVFQSSSMEELSPEKLETIMRYIKTMYTKCDFDLDSDGYFNFYGVVKRMNNLYREKTGKTFVSVNFSDQEVDEVFKDVDWD